MRPLRHLPALLAILLAALAVGVAPASASPEAVLADYYADGVVDGEYAVQDLSRALTLARAQEEAQYADAATAIEAARSMAIAGIRPPGGPGPGADGGAPAKPAPRGRAGGGDGDGGARSLEVPRPEPASVPSALPVPPVSQPGAGVPWPFVVLSTLALLLARGGASASAYRRLRAAARP
jgi:hypothetical protein